MEIYKVALTRLSTAVYVVMEVWVGSQPESSSDARKVWLAYGKKSAQVMRRLGPYDCERSVLAEGTSVRLGEYCKSTVHKQVSRMLRYFLERTVAAWLMQYEQHFSDAEMRWEKYMEA